MRTLTFFIALSIAVPANLLELKASEVPGPTIGVKFVFGKKKLDCLKFGICDIILFFNIEELFGNALTAAENGVGAIPC